MKFCSICNNTIIDKKCRKYCSTACRLQAKLLITKKWNKKNKDKHCKYQKKWRENNRDLDRLRSYQSKQRISNNQKNINRIRANLRSRVYDALKKNSTKGKAIKYLGCTIEELKTYLESQFQEGMSWDNYGSWHIDHIKPLSKFDLTKKKELLKACHYTNLQPLWAEDNLSKGSKF